MIHKSLSRRSLLRATTGTPLLAPALSAQRAVPSTSPNILLILVDDLGFGDLSSFGAKDLRTPNVDAIASSGVRFTNFYANSPVCSPTRAALLSGRYPDLVGVPGLVRTNAPDNWAYLSEKAVLLPQVLKTAGYHTGIVGKWNLGLESPNLPTQRGFDFFHGFLGDMMEDYYTHLRHGRNYMRRNEETIDPKGHATDLFSDWSVDYLNKRKQDGRKFFLYLAYNAPHVPIQPPEEWIQKIQQRLPSLDPKRAKIAALIEHLDASIGRVLGALKANGQTDNTLVIFTSDNGGQVSAGGNCGPWRGAKEDMFEGGIRVPMCASWPGRIPPGSQSEQVALSMDITPTICEAAGVSPPGNLNGASILSCLKDSHHRLSDRDLLWVRRDGGRRSQGRDYYAYRSGDWKILQNHPFEPMRLYNLRDDPGETTDLSEREPKRYMDLVGRLMLHIQEAGQVPWQRQRPQ